MASSVLVVDDDAESRHAVSRVLTAAGLEVWQCATAAAARAVLKERHVSVVLLDIGLPDVSGIELLREVRRTHPDASVLMLTASAEKSDMEAAMHSGAMSYLRKPWDALVLEAQVIAGRAAFEARRAANVRYSALEGSLHDARQMLDRLPRELAQQLCGAWDLRLIETAGHVRRVAAYTEALALTLGESAAESATLGRIAMLHDVGKLAIPDAILTKPARLSADEFETMKLHTVAGARMLAGVQHPFLQRASVVALRHHERWNGHGYPGNLCEDECPADARLVGVADVFDALHQSRCYKRPWTDSEVFAYFKDNSGALFDPEIVTALLDTAPQLREIGLQFPDSGPEEAGTSGVIEKAKVVATASS